MASTSGISFSGLVSGIDTDSIISKLMSIEQRPISMLSIERSKLTAKSEAYKSINTKLAALDTAAFELTKNTVVNAKKISSSDTAKLTVTSTASSADDSFSVDIVNLASASIARTKNAAGYANGIGSLSKTITGSYVYDTAVTSNTGEAATTANGGTKIITLNLNNRLKQSVTGGNFYVNGKEITVDIVNDTMGDVLEKIRTTAGTNISKVSYDQTTGKVALESASPIVLSSGSSNFLSAMKLDVSPIGATRSTTGSISGIQADAKLDDATNNFAQAITADGVLKINGVSISYQKSADTINNVITRINSSNAGVKASYDTENDQFVLVSTNFGNSAINIDISSDTGNLAKALGIATSSGDSSAQTLGTSANYKINGANYYSNSNTITNPAGKTGITMNLLGVSTTAVNVSVSLDTQPTIDAMQSFVDQYNTLVDYIDDATAYDATNKKASTLTGDSTVTRLKSSLDSYLMGMVTNMKFGTSSTGNLTELGISTGEVGSEVGSTKHLVFDKFKLAEMMKSQPDRVSQILGSYENKITGTETYAYSSDKGIFSRVREYLKSMDSTTGVFSEMDKTNTTLIANIDKRVDDLNTRLAAKQTRLEAQFQAMEKVMLKLQNQQTALTGLLSSAGLSSSSSSSS